jgi:hypothetical protein
MDSIHSGFDDRDVPTRTTETIRFPKCQNLREPRERAASDAVLRREFRELPAIGYNNEGPRHAR